MRIYLVDAWGYHSSGHTADLDILSNVSVEYVTMPGWKTSIQQATCFESLPDQCRDYLSFIENFTGIKVEFIGVGPRREDMIRV